MTRCVAEMKDRFFNIPADRMEYSEDSNLILVYDGSSLVAAIDASVILEIHISEVK